VLSILSVAIAALMVLATFDTIRGNRSLRRIAALPLPLPTDPLPRVTIIVAARNEERGIAPAVRSMLALDYPDLELIVVNDRSTDDTGRILDGLAAEQGAALRVVHNTALPDGWLGKNHALMLGSRQATGDVILFTDADIVFEPTALRRAVGYMIEQDIDHLAAGPEVVMPLLMPAAFAFSGTIYFSMFTRPWKARDPKSAFHIGIGAFNLIRSAAYQRIGGHEPIRMRPDDDLKLGKLVKKNGLRQDFVVGLGMVSVAWYDSTRDLVDGLSKNSFAGLDYSVPKVLAAVAGQLLLFVWPVAGLLLTTGPAFAASAITVGLTLLLHLDARSIQRGRLWLAPLYPLVSLLLVFIVLRATLLTLARGGIEWRGTRYPLAELRANVI
jgi:cellulose synthase/poly-beta-1,6-N-acetylglucosamine synthase-like glycosyltransferase